MDQCIGILTAAHPRFCNIGAGNLRARVSLEDVTCLHPD